MRYRSTCSAISNYLHWL